jgi:hypothetical protein
MEHELRNFITSQYGMTAWQQIIKIQAGIRVKKKQEQIEAARRQEEIIEYILIGVAVFVVAGVIMCVFYYALMQ